MYISIEQSVGARYPCYQFVVGKDTPVVANYIIPKKNRAYMEHHIVTSGYAPTLNLYGVHARTLNRDQLIFTKPEDGYAKEEACAILDEKNEQVGEAAILIPTALGKVTGRANVTKYSAEFDDLDETYQAIVVPMGKKGYRIPVFLLGGEQIAIVEKHEKMSYSTKLYDMWLMAEYASRLQQIALLLSYMDSIEFGAAGEFSYIHHSSKSSLPSRAEQEAYDMRRSEQIKYLP